MEEKWGIAFCVKNPYLHLNKYYKCPKYFGVHARLKKGRGQKGVLSLKIKNANIFNSARHGLKYHY